jgi:hypothetical protein
MRAEKFFSIESHFIFDKIEKFNDIQNFDSFENGLFEVLRPVTLIDNEVIAIVDIHAQTIAFTNTEFRFTVDQVQEILNSFKDLNN